MAESEEELKSLLIYRTTTRDGDVKTDSWFEGKNKITGLVVNA